MLRSRCYKNPIKQIENKIYLQKILLFYIQQIMPLEHFIPKGRIVKNVYTGYNLLGIGEMFYSA